MLLHRLTKPVQQAADHRTILRFRQVVAAVGQAPEPEHGEDAPRRNALHT